MPKSAGVELILDLNENEIILELPRGVKGNEL
jgi:hypothetical protein